MARKNIIIELFQKDYIQIVVAEYIESTAKDLLRATLQRSYRSRN